MISCLRKSIGGTDTLYPGLKLELHSSKDSDTIWSLPLYQQIQNHNSNFSLTSNLSGTSKSKDTIGGFPEKWV